MSKRNRNNNNKRWGLSEDDPINKMRRFEAENKKAQQGYKPDWADKYEYGLSDW